MCGEMRKNMPFGSEIFFCHLKWESFCQFPDNVYFLALVRWKHFHKAFFARLPFCHNRRDSFRTITIKVNLLWDFFTLIRKRQYVIILIRGSLEMALSWYESIPQNLSFDKKRHVGRVKKLLYLICRWSVPFCLPNVPK